MARGTSQFPSSDSLLWLTVTVVWKKVLQVTAVFGLLLAGYAGYVRAFALLVTWAAPRTTLESVRFFVEDSKHKREAIALAKKAFGPDHWSTDDELKIRYYQADQN